MAKGKSDLLQGTLNLLILKTLSLQDMHGWGIAKRIQQMSADVLRVNQGSLYPALQRLVEEGLIRSHVGAAPSGRSVKVYSLSIKGRRQLERDTASWRLTSHAVNEVLQAV